MSYLKLPDANKPAYVFTHNMIIQKCSNAMLENVVDRKEKASHGLSWESSNSNDGNLAVRWRSIISLYLEKLLLKISCVNWNGDESQCLIYTFLCMDLFFMWWMICMYSFVLLWCEILNLIKVLKKKRRNKRKEKVFFGSLIGKSQKY